MIRNIFKWHVIYFRFFFWSNNIITCQTCLTLGDAKLLRQRSVSFKNWRTWISTMLHLSEHPWALRAESLRRSQGQQPEDWSGSAGGGDDTQLEDEYSLIYLIVCCDIRIHFCPHICWLIPHVWCETAGLRHLLCGLHLEEVPARVAETCLKPSDGHERDIPSL